MFQDLVTTEAQLRELMGAASPGSLKKETTYIYDEAKRFIELSPMVFLATSGKNATWPPKATRTASCGCWTRSTY
jgi:predicted pyridoxine 5'-phosphate oxidase superfamily flavin-nucleotide-binding protein